MNKDQVMGGMKDIAGKAQEKVGQATGNRSQQAKGLGKQESDEGLADRVHEGRRGEGLAAVEAEERRDTTVGLQAGLIDVEVHAVDAFDLKGDVVVEDIGDGPW